MDVIHCQLPNKTREAGCHLRMTDFPSDLVVHWAAPPNDEYSDLYANDEDSDLDV